MLSVGDKFPKFHLNAVKKGKNNDNPNTDFEIITNESTSGKWMIVFFWPKDFTFVCPTEMIEFGTLMPELEKISAVLYGCSIDNEFVHLAWKKNHSGLTNLPYTILSDIKRELSISLGIIDRDEGVAQRATFIIDPEGIIRHVSVNDLKVGRNPKEILRILNALQTNELCPCSWNPGEKVIKI